MGPSRNIKAAALASPNNLLFPTLRGEVFDPDTRRDLVDKLRAAAAAGEAREPSPARRVRR
jgi:hypothetical protein